MASRWGEENREAFVEVGPAEVAGGRHAGVETKEDRSLCSLGFMQGHRAGAGPEPHPWRSQGRGSDRRHQWFGCSEAGP